MQHQSQVTIDPPVPRPRPRAESRQGGTGSRRRRSPLAMALWLLAGLVLGIAAPIGLGVYFGLQQTNSSIEASFSRNAQASGGVTGSSSYVNSQYGVSALLPGTDWGSPNKLAGGHGESTWRNDHKAHWGYSLRPSSQTSPSAFVKSIQDDPLVKSTGAQTVTQVMYNGYQAIRIETNLKLQAGPLWREVYYVFVANGMTYDVTAGTTVDEWEKGGKDVVAKLLASVSVAHQTVVLDPTPGP
jgi:hypothetical protein